MGPPGGDAAIKALYGSVSLLLLAGFFASCMGTVNAAVTETDLCWMIPSVLQRVEQGSFLDAIRFLFSAGPPKVADFFIKAYLFFGLSWFGVHVRGLILFAIGIHLANTVLLYGLGRLLGFQRRVSFLSAAVYLCLFTHFHATLWPTAAAFHLLSAFLILLVFSLYLKTEQRFSEGRPYRILFWTTVAAIGVASFNRSTFILPVLILTHLLLQRDPQRRVSAYWRWTPLFAVSILEPIYWVIVIRQWATNSLLRRAIELLERVPLPVPAKLLLFSALGVGSILAFGGLLRWLSLGRGRRIRLRWVFLSLAVVAAVLLALYDRRQLLLPYTALVPFTVTLSSFLQPIRAALSLDSSYPFYLFRPALEASDLLLAAGIIGIFLAVTVVRQRQLAVLAVWYAVTLLHFLFQFSNQPVTAPSRHFVYLSPIFCLVFCSVLDFVASVLIRGEPKAKLRQVLLLGVVAMLCAENLVAIRLAEWRGKLVNNYYTYDYIRAARLIQVDLQGRGDPAPPGGSLAVSGVVPMPFGYGTWYFMKVDPDDHRLFRFVLEEVFRDRSMRAAKINPPEGDSGGFRLLYRVHEERLIDERGRSLDPFDRLSEEALLQLSGGNEREARHLFLEAARQRPFLLRFVLPDSCRLEDVRWLTHGLGLRHWLEQIRDTWGKPGTTIPKNRHLARLLEKELSDYEACLFYLSYLGQRHGEKEESRYWLSQLYRLEPDPAVLIPKLSRSPLVQKDPALAKFLATLGEGGIFVDPARRQKDDYAFGRFLGRLLFGWDIASAWDRRLGGFFCGNGV